MATKLVNIDRRTPLLLPVDLRDWVAEDDFVHFVLEAVEGLDVRSARVNERGTGSAQYPPGMLLALLVYSYATGVFSSRRIERSTFLNVAVRYVCADTHPDHDTIATFRRENLALVQESFVQVLALARELGLVRLGLVAVDGTKLLANASKRATVSAAQLAALQAADAHTAQGLLIRAEEADRSPREEGTRLPRRLAQPAQRRARLQAAQAVLAQRRSAGAQVNTTDPDSRLQPPSQPGGGFTQGYNAQAAVDTAPARLIVAARIADTTTDHNQLSGTVAAIPVELGRPVVVVADRGYDSHEDIVRTAQLSGAQICCPPAHRFNPHSASAIGRQRQARQSERLARDQLARSARGQAWLRLRRTTIEPVFGMIKAALGFRRFQLRGRSKVEGEWQLVALAYNLRRLWQVSAVPAC